MKKLKLTTLALASSVALLAACSDQQEASTGNVNQQEEVSQDSATNAESSTETSQGMNYENVLSSTNWQGTTVKDSEGTDLTEENSNFIGLAKYDADTNHYEFFDASTKETRGDEGVFFITNDGKKRVLISETMGYQAVVDLTEVDEEIFTYKRTGENAEGNETDVYVEHVPYNEEELKFTNPPSELTTTTGTIVTDTDGDVILSNTLWQGSKVVDEDGNDLTEENKNFISIAKYEFSTNKYEFFDTSTGESRGDFGYYDVINNNKQRAHVSLGENKYGVALEITELNDEKFTYKRLGQDKDGNEVIIYVEHEPYNGDYEVEFTF